MKASTSIRKTIGKRLNVSWQQAASHSRRSQWALYRQRLQHSDAPILVGPWRGEVGFEALYWIPWLLRLREDLKIDPKRLIPIGRGGSAVWYGVPQGIELFDMRTPQQVRVENRLQHAKTAMLKQVRWTPFDRLVVQDAAETLGLRSYLTLHPHWMYHELAPFWESRCGFMDLLDHVTYAFPLPTPILDGLPENFVAVKFYARPTFPLTDQTRTFVTSTIRRLADSSPVVVLDAQQHLDDHFDFPATGANIFHLSTRIDLTPQNNLAIQSGVVAKAMGFVGTYGGFSQLALSLAKPSVSFYTQWQGTAIPHKSLGDELAIRANIPCAVQPMAQVPLLQSVFPVAENVLQPAPALV